MWIGNPMLAIDQDTQTRSYAGNVRSTLSRSTRLSDSGAVSAGLLRTQRRAPEPRSAHRSPSASRLIRSAHGLTIAQATRVIFAEERDENDNLRATGVEFVDVKTGQKYTARASREVILSAGAVQSPQLLELSGIGNKTLLDGLGIKTRIDNPNVGENYQVRVQVNVEMNEKQCLTRDRQDHLQNQQSFEVPDSIITWDVLSNPVVNASQFAE